MVPGLWKGEFKPLPTTKEQFEEAVPFYEDGLSMCSDESRDSL